MERKPISQQEKEEGLKYSQHFAFLGFLIVQACLDPIFANFYHSSEFSDYCDTSHSTVDTNVVDYFLDLHRFHTLAEIIAAIPVAVILGGLRKSLSKYIVLAIIFVNNCFYIFYFPTLYKNCGTGIYVMMMVQGFVSVVDKVYFCLRIRDYYSSGWKNIMSALVGGFPFLFKSFLVGCDIPMIMREFLFDEYHKPREWRLMAFLLFMSSLALLGSTIVYFNQPGQRDRYFEMKERRKNERKSKLPSRAFSFQSNSDISVSVKISSKVRKFSFPRILALIVLLTLNELFYPFFDSSRGKESFLCCLILNRMHTKKKREKWKKRSNR